MGIRKIRIVWTILLTFAYALPLIGQHISTEGGKIICYANDDTHKTYVAPAKGVIQRLELLNSSRVSEETIFEIDFFNVPVAGQTTIRYAADIWAAIIKSAYPIKISVTWTGLSTGVLGSARPASREANFDGAPVRSVWYPIALAERLARKELNEVDDYEIIINLNQEFTWYFGTDGNPTENTHDLLSVVLHEIGHGLGLSDTFDSDGGNGSWGWNARANIYDVFIFNYKGLQLIDSDNFKNYSTELDDQITSGSLEYTSLSAQKVNSDAFPKIYAPSEFNGGSSISHLDEKTYPAGDTNSLMTPQLSREEAIHNTGPLVNAILADMGYVYAFIDPDSVDDQPDWNADVVVNGIIKSDSALIEDAAFLIYSYDEFVTSAQVPLQMNVDQTQFTAIIPGAGFKTFVEYYFLVTDNNQVTYRSPATDFEDNYKFGMGLVTGIEGSQLSTSTFSIYPNPSSGKINVLYSSKFSNSGTFLRITDLQGKLIHKEQLTNLSGSADLIINLENRPAGMYVAEVVSTKEVKRLSFIIR